MTDLLTNQSPAAPGDGDIDALVGSLPLRTKVELLTGETAWTLTPIAAIGLRALVLSDGPAGVRGTGEDPDSTSLLLPSPTAVSATWDATAAERVGALFAVEARRHGVDVVLAPQVNIQRSPGAGRHFECYSEDPLLTSVIGSAVIRGLQDNGVGACLKHYVANDSETRRTEYVSEVAERVLREVYLAPFEHALREAGVWSIMAAYNGVDDGVQAAPMTEHGHLVGDVLKGELGFDGVMVSDWLAANRTVESATGGLDLIMPGPSGPWGDNLIAAVESGEVPLATIDEKVRRLLLLARRVGKLGSAVAAEPDAGVGDELAFVRGLAASSTVVLRRPSALPALPETGTIALIGPNAVRPHVLGGGSSTVTPAHIVGIADALRRARPDAELVVERGGDTRTTTPALATAGSVDALAAIGVASVTARYLDADGSPIGDAERVVWAGVASDLPEGTETVILTASVPLQDPGVHTLEIGAVGRRRIVIDGVEVSVDPADVGAEVILDSTINNPQGYGTQVTITEPRTVELSAELGVIHAGGYGNLVRAAFRHRGPGEDTDAEIERAVAAAQAADAAVLVVGTNEEVESEGWDRTSLALPGRQDELVRRVLAVRPDAIVVVNAGAPVVLPWLDEARTVLWAWFPGQEAGDAIADVLTGATEPAGRLPWTLPGADGAITPPSTEPDERVRLTYTDGVDVGYRAWERASAVPAAPFGHGLGWTEWEYVSASEPRTTDDGVEIDVVVANAGERAGREIVQAYLEPPAGRADTERPVRWLAGFAAVDAAAGATATATITIPRRALEIWDAERHAWVLPSGHYPVRIGRSVSDLRLARAIDTIEQATP